MRLRSLLSAAFVFGVAVAITQTVVARVSEKPAEPMIGHMVFFTLKDGTAENRQKIVDACKKYLAKHDGTAYFSAGVIVGDLKSAVNDVDFDVALHLVFKDRASHDKYQTAPTHIQFINENKDLWKKVRVFDSSIEP